MLVSKSRSRSIWSWVLKPVVSTISPVAATEVLSSRNQRMLPTIRPTTSNAQTAVVVSPRKLPASQASSTPSTAPVTCRRPRENVR